MIRSPHWVSYVSRAAKPLGPFAMKLTIHLLHDDQPTGPRVAKIDQWSGRAVCAPRSALDEVLQKPELDGPCLYFLIAQAPNRSAPRVYVGEADGFRDRIRSHQAEKD